MLLQLLSYLYIFITLLAFASLLYLDFSNHLARRKYPVPRLGSYSPKTLVMVPCRGVDLTLEQNLRSLLSQRYKNYSVVAIVDAERDPAVKVIKRTGMRFLISSAKCTRCSGKVRALSTAIERLRNYQAYVVVDSDIQVDPDWLASLVRPLQDKRIGLSTMYPYFRSLGGFWSRVKMVWGFVGDSLLEHEGSRFGWGGSLAFRRELMDAKAMEFFKESEYSVSDDICLTKIAKSKGLGIAYVKSPKPVVNCRETFASFMEWSNRQTSLTALGYRHNLYLGLLYYSTEIWILVSSVLLAVFVNPLFLLMLAHYLKSVANACRRSGSANLQIPAIVLMMPFLYDVNLLRASQMRTITWRGRTYKMR